MPIPADPSGSPYQQSPRGLYVPSGPAPESKLGLPVPPPLQPEIEDEPPQPESLPPDADDLDVSFQNRPAQRPAVVPPPPPESGQQYQPRMAERFDIFDRHRQPVNLGVPETELQSGVATELLPEPSTSRRSPVETFSQPRPIDLDHGRGTGHSAPFDDIETDELDEEPLPGGIDSSRHIPQSSHPESLPELVDPNESDLAFPGVHRQTSAERTSRSNKVEPLSSNLGVQYFRLTRDARLGPDADVISAKSLKRGQNVVVQAELVGLKQVQRNGELISRVTYHSEIRDARNRVLFSTAKDSLTEANPLAKSSRQLVKWLAIPTGLKSGDYLLQVHLRDNFSGRTTVIEMPVTIR